MLSQVGDVFKRLEAHHERMKFRFLDFKEKTKDAKTLLLLDFLSDQQSGNSECLKSYKSNCKSKLLNKWVRFYPKVYQSEYEECDKQIDSSSEFCIEDILEFSSCIDHTLIREYDELCAHNNNSCIVELFECLKNITIQKEKLLSKNILWLNDL